MCKRTASWGCTAGLRYAAPRETLDQMVLLRTVFAFFGVDDFSLVFGLSGFPSEHVALRRFFQSSLRKTAFCVFLFFMTAFRESKPYGNSICCKYLAVARNEQERSHNIHFFSALSPES